MCITETGKSLSLDCDCDEAKDIVADALKERDTIVVGAYYSSIYALNEIGMEPPKPVVINSPNDVRPNMKFAVVRGESLPNAVYIVLV